MAGRLLRMVSSPSRSCPRRSLRPAATPPAGAHPPHPPPPVSRHCGYVIRADTELFVRTAAISAHDRRRSRPAAALGSALRPARPHSAPARRPRAPPVPAPAGEHTTSNAKPASIRLRLSSLPAGGLSTPCFLQWAQFNRGPGPVCCGGARPGGRSDATRRRRPQRHRRPGNAPNPPHPSIISGC